MTSHIKQFSINLSDLLKNYIENEKFDEIIIEGLSLD